MHGAPGGLDKNVCRVQKPINYRHISYVLLCQKVHLRIPESGREPICGGGIVPFSPEPELRGCLWYRWRPALLKALMSSLPNWRFESLSASRHSPSHVCLLSTIQATTTTTTVSLIGPSRFLQMLWQTATARVAFSLRARKNGAATGGLCKRSQGCWRALSHIHTLCVCVCESVLLSTLQ